MVVLGKMGRIGWACQDSVYRIHSLGARVKPFLTPRLFSSICFPFFLFLASLDGIYVLLCLELPVAESSVHHTTELLCAFSFSLADARIT